MHKWMWSLPAVALLGLAAGCSKGDTVHTRGESSSTVTRGNEGDSTPADNQSITEGHPEVTGGQNPADQEIYGTVTGVGANSITVRNRTGSTTMTLVLQPNTLVVSQGRRADRDQLREGVQVRAAYDELGGKYEATTVELNPMAAAKPPAQQPQQPSQKK